jgi:hypothetical protein
MEVLPVVIAVLLEAAVQVQVKVVVALVQAEAVQAEAVLAIVLGPVVLLGQAVPPSLPVLVTDMSSSIRTGLS